MNWIDYLIIAFSCFLIILGFRRGLVRELLSIVAIAAGFIVALTSYETCAVFLAGRFEIPGSLLDVLAFAILFLVTSCSLLLVGYVWKLLTAATPVAFIDGLLGATFGLLKAAFIVSIVLMLVASIEIPAVQEVLEGSYIAPHFLALVPRLYGGVERIIPVDIRGFNILKPATPTK